MNYIKEYFRKLEAGKIVTSKRVYNVYKKLVYSIDNPDGFIFDEEKANRPIEFIERFCKHSKGEWAGKPIKLELFQKAYISALFGFIDKETGLRKYRESLFYVARKNGKSTMLAGIALYMMIADGEAGADCYTVATKKDQAKIVFDEVWHMVQQSPELRKYIKKRKSDLYFPLTMSKLQPLGKNSDTLDGLNAQLVIMDELHGVKDRNLYEVMKQSQSARRQPLLIMITTAGTVRECIFDDMYDYSSKVADGTITDDTFLPIMYELDNRNEWQDSIAWRKANPALGSIKKVEDLIQKVERAKQNPKDLTGVLCKDFNVRENSSTAWLTFDTINNETLFDISQFKGSWAVGGCDLSRTTDLTCATLLVMDKDLKRYAIQMYFLPEDNFQKHIKEDRIPYDKWKEAGLLRLCKGNTINPSDVTAWFVECVKVHDVTPAYVYYDAWGSVYWRDDMTANGFRMVPCRQGARTMSIPMQNLQADLEAKRLIYNNNPILKWCLSNTCVEEDRNGNLMPKKSSNPRRRIDGTASLLDAYVGLFEHYNELVDAI